jgi:predicted small lipoprotein YifL
VCILRGLLLWSASMRWLLLALLTLQSATCGQKGPLTLPEPGDGHPPAITPTPPNAS